MVRLNHDELTNRYRLLRSKLADLEKRFVQLLKCGQRGSAASIENELEQLLPKIDRLDAELVEIERKLPQTDSELRL